MELQIITKKSDFINIINNNEYVIVYCGLTFFGPCNKIYPIYDTYIRDFLKLSKFPTFTLLNNDVILDSFMGPNENKLINMVNSINGNDDF